MQLDRTVTDLDIMRTHVTKQKQKMADTVSRWVVVCSL